MNTFLIIFDLELDPGFFRLGFQWKLRFIQRISHGGIQRGDRIGVLKMS
jgi:hypothetical protein